MVRTVDGHGEALIWCRKCSGYARQSMGPKLMKCCNLERRDTKENGKMLKGILILEEGTLLGKDARGWKIEGQKKNGYWKGKNAGGI